MSVKSVNFKELFGLKDNYNKEELKQAFIKKVTRIDKMDIEPAEKELLLREYQKQYHRAKDYLAYNNNFSGFTGLTDLTIRPTNPNFSGIFNPIEYFNNITKQHNKFFKQFDNFIDDVSGRPNISEKNNFQTKSFGTSYSMKSVLNPDGSRTIIETTNKINDGKSDKKINSYKLDVNGKKIPIDLSQAQKQIGYK